MRTKKMMKMFELYNVGKAAMSVVLIGCGLGTIQGQVNESVPGGEPDRPMCHLHEMEDIYFDANPGARDEARSYAEALEEFTRNFTAPQRDGDPYIIPVVFHIVHNYGPENITDEQVKDCIRVMNEDFTASNSGASIVAAAFQGIVGNVGIEFRLAQLDPQGNCTNGIVRTVSPVTNQGGENLKSVSPIWNRARYMNVWVCRTIESGAAGYTYYPSTLAGNFGLTNDGIVVRHDYVGSIGTSTPFRSHVLTHEVGHWINLAHVWGSSNQPGVQSNCDMDDGVADTPNTIGWTGCNTNAQSCGSLDNVENFMEYAYCHRMFTEGQKQRMLASLNSNVASRSNLWQAQNLAITGVLQEPQLCHADFEAPKRRVCVGEEVKFYDFSFNNVESRSWTFPGAQPSQSSEMNPTVVYDQPGLYSVTLTVSDGVNTETETKTHFIRVLGHGFEQVPFSEGFEDLTTYSNGLNDIWIINEMESGQNWEITTTAAYTGQKSTRVRGRLNSQYSSANLYSQTFDLSEVEGNAVLKFKYAYARRNAGSSDRLRVWISRNCGETWSLRRTLQADNFPTVPYNVPGEFVPSGLEEWKEVVITNLTSVFLNETFRLRFEFESNMGNNIYVDDINLIPASMVTSVEAAELAVYALKVYPNPATEQLNVAFGSDEMIWDMRIDLLDLTGRMVKSQRIGNISPGEHVLSYPLHSLPGGVYMLRMQSSTGEAAIRKVVIQ